MPLEILKEGAPVLREKAKPVVHVNASIRRLLDDMRETMKAANGVGLAAPQVGVSKRVIIVDTGDGLHEIINPVILSGEGREVGIEGCLSIPGWVGEVERYSSVRVTGLNRDGRQVWIDGTGLLARALQHEIDHLDGILFTDRAISLIEAVPEDRAQEKHLSFRIVFMGTPEFAVVPLAALLEAGHDVVLVVTQPDRRGNRGRVEEPAVKRFAVSRGLRVSQPESVRSDEFIDMVRGLMPDYIVVAAFGQILPKRLIEVPKFGAVNIHASLLPAYRGASPIQRALMNGDTSTGVTIMKVGPGLDTGDILAVRPVPIEPDDDAESLGSRIAETGAALLLDVLDGMARGTVKAVPQDNKRATYAPRLKPEDEIIDWTRPARDIVNQVRALRPSPGARTWLRGKIVKVWRASMGEDIYGAGDPGTIVPTSSGDLAVVAGEGTVVIDELQPAGKKKMTGSEFIRGYRPAPGDRFENQAQVESR